MVSPGLGALALETRWAPKQFFVQSKYEIDMADRSDLVPSIVTAKHLNSFQGGTLDQVQARRVR